MPAGRGNGCAFNDESNEHYSAFCSGQGYISMSQRDRDTTVHPVVSCKHESMLASCDNLRLTDSRGELAAEIFLGLMHCHVASHEKRVDLHSPELYP